MDYVTIVAVDDGGSKNSKAYDKSIPKLLSFKSTDVDNQFVTVLSIGDSPTSEIVVVHRSPGEKLGFGLKFQGGTRSNEKIERLFIQSCAEGSPASRSIATWGHLRQGDEILEIDGISVTTMSRIECVKKLKESSEAINLMVRNGKGKMDLISEKNSAKAGNGTAKNGGKPPTPPPVPPRKLIKKRSPAELRKEKQIDESSLSPATAEFYLNSLDETDSNLRGFDSDDTGSTISTVVERFAIIETVDQKPKSPGAELVKVLRPFTMLEKEFNIDPKTFINETSIQEDQSNESDQVRLEINNNNNYENVKIISDKDEHNNYENVEMKKSKIELNNYENILFDQVKCTVVPPTPLPRSQPVIEPKKRTKIPAQNNVYKQQEESSKESSDTAFEYKTVENWLKETSGEDDTVHECKISVGMDFDNGLKKDNLPRCIEFLPKDVKKKETNINISSNTTIVKKCIKVTSNGFEDDDFGFNDSSSEDDEEKFYEPIVMQSNSNGFADGESLGPSELLATPGSEAYFNNFQWVATAFVLPTIGEAEEEFSSLEPNSGSGGGLKANGAVDITEENEPKSQPVSKEDDRMLIAAHNDDNNNEIGCSVGISMIKCDKSPEFDKGSGLLSTTKTTTDDADCVPAAIKVDVSTGGGISAIKSIANSEQIATQKTTTTTTSVGENCGSGATNNCNIKGNLTTTAVTTEIITKTQTIVTDLIGNGGDCEIVRDTSKAPSKAVIPGGVGGDVVITDESADSSRNEIITCRRSMINEPKRQNYPEDADRPISVLKIDSEEQSEEVVTAAEEESENRSNCNPIKLERIILGVEHEPGLRDRKNSPEITVTIDKQNSSKKSVPKTKAGEMEESNRDLIIESVADQYQTETTSTTGDRKTKEVLTTEEGTEVDRSKIAITDHREEVISSLDGNEMDRGSAGIVNLVNGAASATSTGTLLMVPPTFSRLPPDGHEFPPNFNEPIIPAINGKGFADLNTKRDIKNSSNNNNSYIMSLQITKPPPLPRSGPPTALKALGRKNIANFESDFPNGHNERYMPTKSRIDPKQVTSETTSEPSRSQYLNGTRKSNDWRKDEKSEKSVRDKIAMFSYSDLITPEQQYLTLRRNLNRSTDDLLSGSTTNKPSHNYLPINSTPTMPSSFAKKARSVENLDDIVDSVPSPVIRTSEDSSRYTSYQTPTTFRPTFAKTQSVEVLNTNPPLQQNKSIEGTILDDNDVDISSKYASLPRSSNTSTPSLARTISFSGYGSSPNLEDRRRNSITNMLEQRKKSMSKLRGLVIPEKVAGIEVKADPALINLPEIKSLDLQKVSSQITSSVSTTRKPFPQERKAQIQSPSVLNIRPKLESSISDNPYQSIFNNRRNFGTSLDRQTSAPVNEKKTLESGRFVPPVKPPRTSLYGNRSMSIPLADDSEDSDSLPSLQSSRKSTPPHSPVVPLAANISPEKFALTRTLSSETNTSIASSTTSTLTSGSGSQASCSSMGSAPALDLKKKILKSSSNDGSVNRRTILASAKSRNGHCNLTQSDEVISIRQTRYDDEDSTDGYDEEHETKRPKPKQRTMSSSSNGKTVTNYKLLEGIPSVVDQVINVATCVEVISIPEQPSTVAVLIDMTSKLILEERKVAIPKMELKSLGSVKKIEENGKSQSSESENEMNDLAKWVRTEAAKSSQPEDNEPSFVAKAPSPPFLRLSSKTLNSESKKMSTADLKKQFEVKAANSHLPTSTKPITSLVNSKEKASNYHDRFSSWESVASNSSSGISSMPATRSLPSVESETTQSTPTDFGSFTSIGSSHSLLTSQDLQAIIEEADPPLQTPDAFVIVLQRDTPEGSIGITLAGGADYETKEITVHKVLLGSLADKDGRLKKGDRILAINGLSMRGLTHRESVTVLKTPRSEVVLAVTRSPSVVAINGCLSKVKRPSLGSLSSLIDKDTASFMEVKSTSYHKSSRSVDLDASVGDGDSVCSSDILGDSLQEYNAGLGFKKMINVPKGAKEVEITKDSCGLGFSIEGGFDSPMGNRPLMVKKVFMGGAAEKSGKVKNGDAIFAINGFATSSMTRVDAWNYMKKLPLGSVRIVIG